MRVADLGPGGWPRPWSGPNGGSCLAAKMGCPRRPGGAAPAHRSRQPTLILEQGEIRAFVEGAKAGLADDLRS